MSKNIKFNVASGTLLYLVNVLVALVMSPFIVKTLGNRDYGVWDVVLSLIGYMGLLDFGMGPALIRYIAVIGEDDDGGKARGVVSSAFFFFLPVGVVSFLVLAALAWRPELVFGAQLGSAEWIGTVLLIVGLNLLIQFPGTVLVGAIMGRQRHFIVNTLRAFLAIGQAAAVYHLLPRATGSGLVVLAAVETGGLVVQYAVMSVVALAAGILPLPSPRFFSAKIVKEMCLFGFKNSMLMLASRLQKQSVPFIIGGVVGLQYVVFFTIPNRLIEYGRGLSMAMGYPLMPYFGALAQSGDAGALREKWQKTSLALQVVTIAMPVFIWILGEPFIHVWMGAEYAQNSRWAIRFLTLGLAAEALSPNAGRFLVGAGKHGRAALMWLVVSVLFIPAAIACAAASGVGGVAFASALASTCGSAITLRYACRELGITLTTHLGATVTPILPAAVSAFCVMLVASRLVPMDSYAALVAVASVGLLFYLSLAWFGVRRTLKFSRAGG